MLNEPDDAARCQDEASKQYRLAGMADEAVHTLHAAANHWYAKGNVTRAAQARGSLGEWLVSTASDNTAALTEFTTAAEYYIEDQKPAYVFSSLLTYNKIAFSDDRISSLTCISWYSLASKWRVKAAETSAQLGDFAGASTLYTSLAEEAMGNPTMKYSAKNYLFNACICSLALNDEVSARRALDKAVQSDPLFTHQPHHRLVGDLITAMFENQDPGEFSQRLQEFERGTGSKFDNYQVSALLAAKRAIVEAEEEFS